MKPNRLLINASGLATAVAVCLFAAPTVANAQIIYQQNFESTAIGSKPSEVRALFNFGSGNPAPGVSVQTDATLGTRVLQAVPTNTFAALAFQLPSVATLGSVVGDSVTTSLRFRTSATPSNTQLRIGLFNLNGSTFPATDNTPAPFNGDFGYRTDVSLADNGNLTISKEFGSFGLTRVATVGPVTYDARPESEAGTPGGGADAATFGGSAGFGAGTNIGTAAYNLSFSLVRATGGGVTLTSSLNGAVIRTLTVNDTTGNDVPGTAVGQSGDNTGVFSTFDYLAIGLGNQSSTLFVDNIQVAAAVVPEAGTLPLALAALSFVGTIRFAVRRRK